MTAPPVGTYLEEEIPYQGNSVAVLWSEHRAKEEHETCFKGSEYVAYAFEGTTSLGPAKEGVVMPIGGAVTTFFGLALS